MVKVVQINVVYEYGSTGKSTMEFDLALKKEGCESYVFCTNKNKPDEGIYCMGTPLSRKIHGFLSRLTGLQGYYSKNATRKMLHKLDEIKPDVVMLHNLHGNYIHVNMLLDYLAKNQIPTVIILHDCWLFTGHCCHYLEEHCDSWQYGCGSCPAKHKWNKSWFFDRSEKVYADRKARFGKLKSLTVVGVSDWVTNECRKSFMKENARFLRIYNWIDLETFRPRDTTDLRMQLGIAENEKVLLGVASGWSDQKGLREMLLAAKRIPESKVVMVGKMPKNVEIPANMIRVGVVTDPIKLSEYYSMADLFLNPSVQETFGKTTAEALSCGTPAIVYNTTACPELVGPGCGKVVPAFNRELFIQSTIQQLAENNEKTKYSCQDFAKAKFSAVNRIEEYIDVLKELTQAK